MCRCAAIECIRWLVINRVREPKWKKDALKPPLMDVELYEL